MNRKSFKILFDNDYKLQKQLDSLEDERDGVVPLDFDIE